MQIQLVDWLIKPLTIVSIVNPSNLQLTAGDLSKFS